jgi:hypothetical protein
MWPVTLREEHRLSVLENSMVRKIFWPRMDEVTGMWRRLHNELYSLCSLTKDLGVQEERNEQSLWHI